MTRKKNFPIIQRTLVIVFSLSLLILTLFYTEHQSVRGLKNLAAVFGLIDSAHTVVGITDVRSFDHTIGDLDADVVLLEYSDFTCSLCAAMQENFRRIVREQKVLLVTRHLYPAVTGAAFDRAVAAECVAKFGGEGAYRQFADYLYGNQYTIRGNEDLTKNAVALGIPAQEFSRCLESDEMVRTKILNESAEGFRLGAKGTPYIVVVYKNEPIGVSYANEYGAFLDRIELLLKKNRGT